MPPPKMTWAQRKTRANGVLFMDLRDQLAVWFAFQFIRVESEIVGLRTVIAEVGIAV